MKFDVWFCRCGHIHLMPSYYLDWIVEGPENRSIVRVCQSCGATYRMWLDEHEDGFDICGNDFYDKEIQSSDCKVILNRGICVPMKSGLYASYHTSAGIWLDDEYNYNDLCEDEKKAHSTVDTARLIKEIERDFGKEYAVGLLTSISAYVSGIDWDGTPFSYEARIEKNRS